MLQRRRTQTIRRKRKKKKYEKLHRKHIHSVQMKPIWKKKKNQIAYFFYVNWKVSCWFVGFWFFVIFTNDEHVIRLFHLHFFRMALETLIFVCLSMKCTCHTRDLLLRFFLVLLLGFFFVCVCVVCRCWIGIRFLYLVKIIFIQQWIYRKNSHRVINRPMALRSGLIRLSFV